MTRKEYLIAQKKKGKRLFGVFPAHYPKEILWALNVLPVEIWDPPLELTSANTHLQPYICPVVKLGLELILQGKCDDLEGFLFPHTCDSIQNLASIVNDYLDLKKPCYFFYHPKAPYRISSQKFYLEALKNLASRLEEQLGPLDLSELKLRVRQGQRLSSILEKIYEMRTIGALSASNSQFYQLIRQGEFLHPDDFIPLLQQFVISSRGKAPRGPAVILSGVLPNPPKVLALLDELGVPVADDDFLNCSRRLLVPSSEAKDPFEAMTDSYFAMPPCTTKNAPITHRLECFKKKIHMSGAKGVIFCMVKFCEPEFFDLPQMVDALKKEGVATLIIESELNHGLSGQVKTRVEAFVEMLD